MHPRTSLLCIVVAAIALLGCRPAEKPAKPEKPQPAPEKVETPEKKVEAAPAPQPEPEPVPEPEPEPEPAFTLHRECRGDDRVLHLTVENSRIRVTFVPDLGGRVTEYVLKQSGRNQLWTNPEFKRPDEVDGWYAYGGLDDHLKTTGEDGAPQTLAMSPYECWVDETPEAVTVTLVYETDTWRLVREHVVYPDSTRLLTRETVTNLGDEPRELGPRPHPVFAVGGDADANDYMIAPAGGAVLTQRYARPYNRDVSMPARSRWAAAVDAAKKEAVVLSFNPDEVNEVALWLGNGSYNVEPMCARRTLKKDESTSMSFDMCIVSEDDLTEGAAPLPVDKEIAQEVADALRTFTAHAEMLAVVEADAFYAASWGVYRLELPKVLSLRPETLSLAVRASTFDAAAAPPQVDAKVLRERDGGEQALAEPEQSLENVAFVDDVWVKVPGQLHHVWTFTLDASKWEDGAYGATLHVGAGARPGTASQKIILARDLPAKVDKMAGKETVTFQPKYAAAKFHLGALERAGDVGGSSVPAAPSVYGKIDHLRATIDAVIAGKYAEPKTGGFDRFYFSSIDDSAQAYRVYVPTTYEKTKKMPLVVYLHGRDPLYRPFELGYARGYMEEMAERDGAVMAFPHGRGNLGYRGASGDDVMTAIQQMRADFNIDPDRICLAGGSMGGGGAWRIAEDSPSLFAAVAPIFGPADWRVGVKDPEGLPPYVRFGREAASQVERVESLTNTPVYVYHGVKDETVSVEHSRHMVARLKELGGSVTYEEDPEGIHRLPRAEWETAWKFLLEQKLGRKPKRVVVRAPYLRDADKWWAGIDAFEKLLAFGELRAEAVDGVVNVTTSNVTAFTIDLRNAPVDRGKDAVVVINGSSAFRVPKGAGKASFTLDTDEKRVASPFWESRRRATSKPDKPVKDSGVEGPVQDVFRRRFIFVVGTAASDEWDAACRTLAENYNRDVWRRVQHVDCIIKTDKDLTDEDRRTASLILVGGPDVNTVTKELAKSFPVTFDKDGGFTLDGQTFKEPDAAVAMICPSPKNIARYVLLLGANSPAAMGSFFAWRNWEGTRTCDYTAFRDTEADDAPAPFCGIFDENWKYDRTLQWGRKAEEKPEEKPAEKAK